MFSPLKSPSHLVTLTIHFENRSLQPPLRSHRTAHCSALLWDPTCSNPTTIRSAHFWGVTGKLQKYNNTDELIRRVVLWFFGVSTGVLNCSKLFYKWSKRGLKKLLESLPHCPSSTRFSSAFIRATGNGRSQLPQGWLRRPDAPWRYPTFHKRMVCRNQNIALG